MEISDLSFEPPSITITVGDSVRWKNGGIIQHTATGSFWDTGAIDSGASSSSVTFSAAGEFGYVCSFHSGQTGTIVVQNP
ncbi:MAG: plastocyanin/azurin family copper-binding protein [Acidimicrobiia bacterium]